MSDRNLPPSQDELDRRARAELIDEVIDEAFEDDDGHSPASLDALADTEADRYYATDFDPHDGFPYPR